MTQSISKMAEEYVATFWPEQPNKAVIQMAFVAGAIAAEERHAKELQALSEKCYCDVKALNLTWEESDKKIDAMHLKELQQLKDRAVEEIHTATGKSKGEIRYALDYLLTQKLNKNEDQSSIQTQ